LALRRSVAAEHLSGPSSTVGGASVIDGHLVLSPDASGPISSTGPSTSEGVPREPSGCLTGAVGRDMLEDCRKMRSRKT